MTRLSCRIAQLLLLLGLPVILGGTPLRAVDFGPTDYDKKATLVWKFLRNVTWTNPRKKLKDQPIIIGVFGSDPIGESLKEITQSKTVNNRPVSIRYINALEEIPACHVLIIGRAEENRVRELVRESRREGVLSVGESEKFLEAGGVIQFVKKGANVGYIVDVRNAKREGLEPSGYLLNSQSPPQSAIARPSEVERDRRVAGNEPRL